MNADRILQELQLEAAMIDRRAVELAAAIDLFQRLATTGTAADSPAPAAEKQKRRSSANVDWARARQQYENGGVAVSRIALNFKVAQSAVYRRIKDESWQRPEPKDAD